MPDLMPKNPMPTSDASAATPMSLTAPDIGKPAAPPMRAPEPAESPVEKKNVDLNDIIERINKLYDSATELQREADEIRKSIEKDSAKEAPTEEPMTPAETEAANNALIGL